MAEFQYWMMPRDGVINTFVLCDEKGQVTDMCGFYTLPSTIIGNPEYNTLKAAYSYYNVATTVKLDELMYDALILAKQLDFDVFNALDLMDNTGAILTPFQRHFNAILTPQIANRGRCPCLGDFFRGLF